MSYKDEEEEMSEGEIDLDSAALFGAEEFPFEDPEDAAADLVADEEESEEEAY